MKIVAFAGSSSLNSINKRLVQYTCNQFSNATIDILDLNDYEMTIFSVDKEKNGFPKLAHDFRNKIEQAQVLIISLAEHNQNYSAAFKNILDWCSRIDTNLFTDKPMFLMSTSPGGYGGGNVMNIAKTFFPKYGANICETFSLPSFNKNFDEKSGIIDPELKKNFKEKLNSFKEKIKALK